MRNSTLIALAGGVAAVSALAVAALAEPVTDKLVIDEEIPITTRAPAVEGHPLKEVISGWNFRTKETRELEADSFQNPGMLTVEAGEELWNTVDGTEGKSCATCHSDAAETMAGVGAGYPKWNAEAKQPFNLALQVNACRETRMGAKPYKFDAVEQRSLVAYIKNKSLGTPVKINLAEGEMQAWWERGKKSYFTPKGQLNLSCANCHQESFGKMIRADHLSQGQINGFPTYRLKNGLKSVHNRFRGCLRNIRASYPAGLSDELMALEVYVAWRGTGLSVETPAVRN